MRAAVLHGPDDLRVEEVDEPAGEVLVRVEAATACGTDVKMLRHGHRVLGAYPSRFGHETAGVRLDTGERVLVGGHPEVAERSLVPVLDPGAGNHLRADQTRPVAAALPAQGLDAHPGHPRQHHARHGAQ